MYISRYAKRMKLLPWLLSAVLVLRSFIAPGYMLSVSAENGLDIVFCNGPVSIEGHMDRYGHHHGDEHSTHGEKHLSPICSQWSTSSLLVFNAVFEAVVFDKSLAENIPAHSTLFFQRCFKNNHVIRGPPVLV